MKLYTLLIVMGMSLPASAQSTQQHQPTQPTVIRNSRQLTLNSADVKPYKRNMTWYLDQTPQKLILQYDYQENGQPRHVERTLDITNTTQKQREKIIQEVENKLNLSKVEK